MNLLEFLGFKKVVKEVMPSNPNVLQFPTPVAKPEPKEHYRVGRREDGMTTLTVMSGSGFGSITLTMNEPACEQLIRMLRSTYDGDAYDNKNGS